MAKVKALMTTVGPNGNLYITDDEGRVHIYDTTNNLWSELELPERI